MTTNNNEAGDTSAQDGGLDQLPAIDLPVQLSAEAAPQSAASSDDPVAATATLETSVVTEAPVEETAFTLEPMPALGNVTQEYEIFIPIVGDRSKMEDVELALPTTTYDRTQRQLDAIPNIDLEANPGGERWGQVLEQSNFVVPAQGGLEGTVNRKEAQFRQGVMSEKGMLAAGQPKLKEDTAGVMWTGEHAVMRVKSIMGMGSIVQVPLWHSGFWVTIKAPAEGDLLELNRRLAEEKVMLGRMTHGLAYANSSVFFSSWLMNFIIEHILQTTLKPGVLEAKPLRERIKSPDLQILAWGMACAIWPRGFPYARAVVDPKGEQSQVIRELVAVGKLLWVDNASLTPWQVAHMGNRMGQAMSEDSLEKYQVEFTRGKGRSIQLHDRVSLNLKVPSLQEYINSGHKWVNGIVAMVDRAFAMEPGSEARNNYIIDQGRATFMRQYGHWVESITVDGQATIDHPETVEKLLDSFSSKLEHRETFFKGVRDYIDDSTIALIAIPATEKEDKSDLPRFPNLLPIDAQSVFFILLVQKVVQIQQR